MRIPVLSLSFIFLVGLVSLHIIGTKPENPVRIGIDGLSSEQVYDLLNQCKERTDIQIVGIVESNKERAQELANQYGFDMAIVYDDLITMVEKTNPEGVVAFNSKPDVNTVEVCAARGIHVMTENPMSVSADHAGKIVGLVSKGRGEKL